MLCREVSLVKFAHRHREITCLKCRSWGCEECQPDRQRGLQRLARNGHPNMFITLTHKNNGTYSREEAAKRLSGVFNIVAKRIRRLYGYKRLPYLCVFEAHKSGYPHLHILLRCEWIDQKVLSAWCSELLDSPIVDVRRVKNQSMAAFYVTKYVGKAPGKFGTSKRYWHSKDWISVNEPERHLAVFQWGSTERTTTRFLQTIRQWLDAGARVSFMSDYRARAWWPDEIAGSIRLLRSDGRLRRLF